MSNRLEENKFMNLLTGSSGFIGKNLKELLPPMLCPTHEELDLTDRDKVKDYLMHNKPEVIIHCGSNDEDVCLYDNLRMFYNLAESRIPMITFCTGREIEDRTYKNGEYVFSKHLIKELALNKYQHITVIQLWGCFGKYEKDIRFFRNNIIRVETKQPILVGENKLFSYIYVNDLAKIIERGNFNSQVVQVVAYTKSLANYAQVLKKVTCSAREIIEKDEDFYHSYVGINTCDFNYTPLETALRELWENS
jgi:UDP-glucose 4-epimerase